MTGVLVESRNFDINRCAQREVEVDIGREKTVT